jgi:hypothetical protein
MKGSVAVGVDGAPVALTLRPAVAVRAGAMGVRPGLTALSWPHTREVDEGSPVVLRGYLAPTTPGPDRDPGAADELTAGQARHVVMAEAARRVAQAEEFTLDAPVSHRGFRLASRRTSSRTSSGTGGRPVVLARRRWAS